MHEVIQIMHVCYTALHYKLRTQDIIKINYILKVILTLSDTTSDLVRQYDFPVPL